MKLSLTMPVIVKSGKGEEDVANEVCLRSDLVEEWGDVSAFCGVRCPSINVRESEAVVRIE